MKNSCPIQNESFQVINIFKNGLTDDRGSITDVTQIKNLMTCYSTQIDMQYVQTLAHMKIDYTTVIHTKNGKIQDVTFWI